MISARHKGRRNARTFFVYLRTLAYEFRASLVSVALVALAGAVLFAITPHASLGGHRPSFPMALYAAWMAMLSETVLGPPETWYLAAVNAIYPLAGFALIGEGVVRFAMLMVSRRRGEKEWMRVMASTYRDHVVLCGIGRLGFRVLEQLLAQGQDVVVIEKDPGARFLGEARATGVPVLVRDMTDDTALVEAGVPYARAIVAATNDDVANLEAAVDARRLNPTIRICLRMYEQTVAAKLQQAFGVDAAFSSSALAAPAVAGMTLGTRVLSSCTIGGVAHVNAEVDLAPGSPLAGRSVGEVEAAHRVRVVARTAAGATAPEALPAAAVQLTAGDRLVVHAPMPALGKLAGAARGS